MGTPVLWAGFLAGLLLMVVIDLLVVRSRGGVISARAAGLWTGFYVLVALCFAGFLFMRGGGAPAVTFLTAWVIEYALSVDNLFVFVVIFDFFAVKQNARHKLLYWGVLGAFVLRGVLIGFGTALVSRFTWLLYGFGAFLLYTAYKLLTGKEDDAPDPEANPVLRWARKVLPVSKDDHGTAFFALETGKRVVTPLLLVLLVVETSDLLFALDSIPAALGISQDAFLIFTANACAVMGLRSLFFVVSSLIEKFRYLKIGLGIILAGVGLKLILETAFAGWTQAHETLTIAASLGFVAVTLTVTILASALIPPPPPKPDAELAPNTPRPERTT